MALPFLSFAGPVTKLALTAKITYVVHKAYSKGWDPAQTGKALLDDIWIVLGISKRGAQAAWYAVNAYEAKTIADANEVSAKLQTLYLELIRDQTLAEKHLDRLTNIHDRFDALKKVAYIAAAFHMTMKQPFSDTSDEIDQTLFGLYLYGKTGQQLSFEERNHVIMKLLGLMEISTTYAHKEFKTVFSIFSPEKHIEVIRTIEALPEWSTVLDKCDDNKALGSILYSLTMDDVEIPTAVSGGTLHHAFS